MYSPDYNVYLYTVCESKSSKAIIAYLLGITKVDSIKYNLMFDRFLSIHRKGTIPDIDIDVPSDYREAMFKYTIDTYGIDHCAAVSTFSIRKARSAIRSVCKLYNIDLKTEDKIKWADKRHQC